MAVHAKYSPSGYNGWSRCSEWESNSTESEASRMGTLAHQVAECMLNRTPIPDCGLDMRVDMERYVEWIEGQVNEYVDVMVEQSLDISWMTGELGAKGTADCILVDANKGEIAVIDLKYGYKPVSATNNGQLRMYAAAALKLHDDMWKLLMGADEPSPYETVRMVIYQPRRDAIEEEIISATELMEWAHAVKPATEVRPTALGCQWCARKSTCQAHAEFVLGKVKEIPERQVQDADAEHIANAYSLLDMVESWCQAIREEARRRLYTGLPVPGLKLVAGAQGKRKWSDENEVERALKAMRVKREVAFESKLISPTSAEKLFKSKVLGPRQWEQLQGLIERDAPKPIVAALNDRREAINASEIFEAV